MSPPIAIPLIPLDLCSYALVICSITLLSTITTVLFFFLCSKKVQVFRSKSFSRWPQVVFIGGGGTERARKGVGGDMTVEALWRKHLESVKSLSFNYLLGVCYKLFIGLCLSVMTRNIFLRLSAGCKVYISHVF
jgi:hypothetical protein